MTKNRKPDKTTDGPITPVEYGGLQAAFDYLNAKLFDGTLPNVFITYQRRAHSGGYFSPDRFASRVNESGHHEIALNPDGFIGKTDEFIVSILLHEMVHLWQHIFGKRPSRAYHDKQWAAKMKSLGLMPSSTGAVGGKETGASMSHYIIPSGACAHAFTALHASGWKLNLQSAIRAGGSKAPPSKVKFSCALCDQNAWGKPDLAIRCDLCNARMLPAHLLPMLPENPPDAMPVGSYEQSTAPRDGAPRPVQP
jgi:predicted SprT family Zn-dependent metalloprotease